eukprot:TRINITY_DN26507_c0_g1_i1.p1 TRINITY_DN26507_c0_g1~~TRINITY_DN26507_c0_g1_i1.p1  ORF type:complete len:383 (+),score=45.63 TRINITY_DN26507_c0_g1_i1:102-1250(+)
MNIDARPPSSASSRGIFAEDELAELLAGAGWRVEREGGPGRCDLRVSKGVLGYAIESKVTTEARPDRVIALLSQAILEARHYAHVAQLRPLSIVRIGKMTASLVNKVANFQALYAPDTAIGLVSDDGGRFFIGEGLRELNDELPHSARRNSLPKTQKAFDLFTDLNQWMLKVLLAADVPEQLLAAPRIPFHSVTELADGAKVSAMSASRFVRALMDEGFLDESSRGFRLVRRSELFRRWQAAAMRPAPEVAMSFLLPGENKDRLQKMVANRGACFGLFAAADRLRISHVTGVPSYIYIPRSSEHHPSHWPGLVPVQPNEPPKVIIKQASAPQSVFRGAVRIDEVLVADALQIWLDVSAHPSRGAEQAEHLKRTALQKVFADS